MDRLKDAKNIKCVIFDFDGVLADTETGRFGQLAEILSTKGIDLNQRLTPKHLIGLSTISFLEKYFPEFNEKERDEISYIRQMEYLSNLKKYCVPYPYVNETIEIYSRIGFRLILATANDTKTAHILLEHVGVHHFFSDIYGREIMEDSNGHKQYHFLRDKLNIPVDECVVVEDSMVGVSAAKRAGFFTIAMNRYNDNEIKQIADCWINDYHELTNIFGIKILT